MIIKTKVCAGGGRSLTRFPIPKRKMEECLTPDGRRIDIAKAMDAFTGNPACFQISDRDGSKTLWASFVFVEQMGNAFDSCVKNNECDIHDHAVTRQDEKITERIDRKCVWVRQNVKPNAEGVTVSIRVDNPEGLIGQSVDEANAVAATYAQMWLRIQEQTTVMTVRIEIEPALLERAKRNNERAALRVEYADCPRRHDCNIDGGVKLCSPCKFDCPLFRDGGKCGYGEKR